MRPETGTFPVFPITHPNPKMGEPYILAWGLTRRDWFATFAPEPTQEELKIESDRDRVHNPHKKKRDWMEIAAKLRYRYADAMIAAAQEEK